jgi:hypothetical protein
MNPLVKVTAAAGSTDSAAAAADADADALACQDLVIATGLPLGQLQQLNEAARQAGANFMAGGAGGPGGWFFVDLRQHTYVPKVRQYTYVLKVRQYTYVPKVRQYTYVLKVRPKVSQNLPYVCV